MKNIFKKFKTKRHYLLMEKENVTTVISIINNHYLPYIDQRLDIGDCDMENKGYIWFIHFDSNDEQWQKIKKELNGNGFELVIRNEDICLAKKGGLS